MPGTTTSSVQSSIEVRPGLTMPPYGYVNADYQWDDASHTGQIMGDALSGGMGAMSSAKGIVDIEIAEGCELAGESGIVLLLFRVEAQIFQQQDLAGL